MAVTIFPNRGGLGKGAASVDSSGNAMFTGAVIAKNTRKIPEYGVLSGWGDSMMSNNMFASWMEYMAMQSGGKWVVGFNGGVGGETSDQIRARFDAGVGTYGESVVFIGAGANNPSTAISDLIYMVRKTISLGLTPVVVLYGPRDASTAISMTYRYAMAAWCWINHVAVIDPFVSFIKQDGSGNWNTGAGRDAIHPTTHTAAIAGGYALTQLNAGGVGALEAALSKLDIPSPSTDGYFSRGNFVASSGGLATGWTLASGSGTPSIAAGACGNIQTLTASSLSANTHLQRAVPALSQWSPGDEYLAIFKYEVSGLSNAIARLACVQSNSGSGETKVVDIYGNHAGVIGIRSKVLSDRTNIYLQAHLRTTGGTFSGVLSIEQVNMMNLTRMGVV